MRVVEQTINPSIIDQVSQKPNTLLRPTSWSGIPYDASPQLFKTFLLKNKRLQKVMVFVQNVLKALYEFFTSSNHCIEGTNLSFGFAEQR